METQPIRLDKKEFQALLKEIQTYNKLDLIAQAFQTKYAKENAGEDDEDARKSRKESNDFLKKINESILKGINQTTKVADKIDKLSNNLKSFKPISDIKDERPVTAKEGLKSLVAGTKGVGSGIKSAFTKTVGAVSRPVETIKKAIGGATTIAKDVYQGTKDIISTPEEYSVEGGRFAEAYSKTEAGTKFQKGGKGSLDVGLEKFNELKAKEEKIKEVQTKIDDQKAYGFEPGKGDVKELEKLKADYSKADIRQKQPAEAKTDSPNVINEPSEIIAEETKKHTQTFDQLLDVTKESLTELKSIRASLEGSQQIPEPLKKGVSVPTPGAAAAASAEGAGGGMSPLDLLGRGGGAAAGGGKAAGAAGVAKAGFGAKALGVLKAGGAMLGKGALVAGKAVMGAALAKPALIAAGVGLAAYGAYKGYQALTGGADEDEKKGGEEKASGDVKKSGSQTVNLNGNMFSSSQSEGKYFLGGNEVSKEAYDNFKAAVDRHFNPSTHPDYQEVYNNALKNVIEEKKNSPFGYDEGGLTDRSFAESKAERNAESLIKEKTLPEVFKTYEARQAGGPITEGKPYLVGETGPEVIVPKETSTVVPKNKKAAKSVPQLVETIDMGEGRKKEIMEDGSYTISDAEGVTKFNAKGVATTKITSGFGFRKEEDLISGDVKESYSQGPLHTSQKRNKAGEIIEESASYDMGLAKVSASRKAGGETKTSTELRGGSEENAAMKDEMAAGKNQSTPIVMNNVSNNNQTTYVPIKGEPRPGSRGSALDNYTNRVATY
jgi:hypothetical protein